ncbi:MAG: hypothetical protein LC113_08440 [Acidobacteria bacterium]|nr:hypothetical protein [Acidobacteriota bacterium]
MPQAALEDDRATQEEIREKEDKEGTNFSRFEIGGHFTNLQFGTFDPEWTREWHDIAPLPPGLPYHPAYKNPKDPGVGVRFSYNINRSIAVEAEANWLFQKEFIDHFPLINQSPYPGGNKFQMLFGPKIGKRWKKFGVFGKVRPGFIHFNRFPVIDWIQQVPPGQPFLTLTSLRRAKFFNVDVGGVFEYYTSKRTMIRFDVGDTIIRYNAQDPKQYNPNFTRHNLQMNLGFGFRF